VYGFTQDLAAGSQQLMLDEKQTGFLSGGVYLVKMSAGGSYLVRKVVKD
jgi:hypothetical protein